MKFKQEAPFAVQVELSEGCNLYCDFCGLQGIRTQKEKDFKFMTLDNAKMLASQIRDANWNPRIEFAMHGEPTMNPDYIRIVKAFRKRLPKHHIMMTSNGGGLLRPPGIVPSLNALFDAGLNIFAFDAYEYVKIKDKIDEVLFDESGRPVCIESNDRRSNDGGDSVPRFEIHRYPDERDFSPHNRYPLRVRKFIRIQDISVADTGTHSSLNNHCGAGSKPLSSPMEARCAKPFREISVRYDGSVAICCNDWRGIYKCGNVFEGGIEAVWQSDAFNSARRFLMQGDRAAINPCKVCDAKSYRVGLLPDKKGQVKMREPNETDRQIVKNAARGDSLTEAVVRPWEIKRRKHDS